MRIPLPQTEPSPRERIHALDLIRGVLILGMIGDHILYDCVTYLGVFEGAMSHPARMSLHYLGAYLFVLLSGASASVSRSNLKRGLMLMGIALGVTLVTFLANPANFIVFGILHCLAACAILYALMRPALERIPHGLAPVLWILLTLLFTWLTAVVVPESGWFWPFGFENAAFVSADYYPLLPWLFVYLLGAWAGPYIFGHRLPAWFYRMRCAFLEKIGRWSLWVYILHQPVALFIILVLREMYFR